MIALLPSSPPVAGVPPAPPPATGSVRDEAVEALRRLVKDGVHLTAGVSSSGSAGVAPEQFARLAREAGPAASLHLDFDSVCLPVAGVEDLAALATIYAAGLPAGARHPGLLGALRALVQAGATFRAVDAERRDGQGQPDAHPVAVGAYGAWLALGGSPRLHDVSIQVPSSGGGPVGITDVEQAASLAFFSARGHAEDLAHPATARTIHDLDGQGARFWTTAVGSAWVSARDAYQALHEGRCDRLWFGSGSSRLGEVSAERLEQDPGLATQVMDRVERFRRLSGVARNATTAEKALCLLDEPVGDRPLAEREAAMAEVLSIPRKWGPLTEEHDYRQVAAAVRPGEPMVVAAREFGRVAEALGGTQKQGDLDDAFRHYRALPALAAKRYLEMLAKAGTHRSAEKACDLVYGDGSMQAFGPRLGALDGLVEAMRTVAGKTRIEDEVAFAEAVEVLDVVIATTGEDEDVAVVASRFVDLAGHVAKPADAREAFRFMRASLALPADVERREGEDRFLHLLQPSSTVAEAEDAWSFLAACGTRQGLELRSDLLDRLLARGRPLRTAVGDLKDLERVTLSEGGLDSPAGARLARFVEVSSSYEDARRAVELVERARLPEEASTRESVYLEVAEARQQVSGAGKTPLSTQAKDDYWYVVRAAGSGDPVPVARQYARLLVAAKGNADEARSAQAMLRGREPDGVAGRREDWMARALASLQQAPDAERVLRWAEEAGPDPAAVDDRLAAFEGVVPIAKGVWSQQVVQDAVRVVEALESKSGDAAQRRQVARILADIGPRIHLSITCSDGKPMDHFRHVLIDPSPDLAHLEDDLSGFRALLDVAPANWSPVEDWRELSQLPREVTHAERVHAFGSMVAGGACDQQDPMPYFRAVAAGARDADDLDRGAEAMNRLLPLVRKGLQPREVVETYTAIRDGLRDLEGLPGGRDPSRLSAYVDLVRAGASWRDVHSLLAALRVPAGTEPLSERDEALRTLWAAEKALSPGRAADSAVRDFRALENALYPGESLAGMAALFAEMLPVLKSGEVARSVISRLQAERMEGGFPDRSPRELVERFMATFVSCGDVERSVAALHRSETTPVVVDEEETVVVGGVRIKKRKPA